MRGNLRGRLDRLEQREVQVEAGVTWTEWGPVINGPLPEPSPDDPALQFIRREWARLGIPDPGTYGDMDILEEGLRLAALPDPGLPPGEGIHPGAAEGAEC